MAYLDLNGVVLPYQQGYINLANDSAIRWHISLPSIAPANGELFTQNQFLMHHLYFVVILLIVQIFFWIEQDSRQC
jgi:hypothetical protein